METERLRIRALETPDFEEFFKYISDQNLCRMYYGLAGDVGRATAEQIFNSFYNNGGTYALEYKPSGKMIGHLIVTALELPEETARELGRKKGITVAFAVSPDYQGRGVMTEALHAVIKELFNEYDYIHCAYFDFNHVSEHLQNKFGFQKVASKTVKIRGGEITIIHNVLYRL